jgi:ATP-dependent protease Clp ATPase subunit
LEVKEFLDQYVIGQDATKKSSRWQSIALKRIHEPDAQFDVELSKSTSC